MLHKSIASVQRNKSKRAGATRVSRISSINTITTIEPAIKSANTVNKFKNADIKNRHQNLQKQVREQGEEREMTSRVRQCIWQLGIVIFGICSICAGIFLLNNWIDIFTRKRGEEMALSPTSRAFEGWKVSPLPLDFDVYLFNWTNPEDIDEGVPRKPHFVQLGPYRFREKPDKVDIEWHNQNASVSFRKKAYFYFDAAGSNGTLEDVVTSVNTVGHTGALKLMQMDAFMRFAASIGLNAENVYETRTAEEWIFKGFSLLSVSVAKFLFPEDVPYDRIGYLYPRNGSSSFEGDINIFTGADDINKMGQIHSWNNLTHTGAFEGECGRVKGSMGEFFPSNLKANDSVYLFMPKMCRAVPLDYTETIKVHGVTAYKFSGTRHAVDNGTMYPDTTCLCAKGKCKPAGVIDIGRCAFNTSMYMSYPHFYLADPSYLEAVDGLKPEKAKHEFFMALEPNAGVPMDVGGGFQANYYLEPVEYVSPFRNVRRVMIPLMWAEERVRVTEDIAADIALVPQVIMYGQIVTGILLAGGLICTCWYPTRQLTRLCHRDDPKAKSSVMWSLPTKFGRCCASQVASAAPSTRQNTDNDRVAVRLVDYRRSSGVEEQSSASDCLISNRPTNVII